MNTDLHSGERGQVAAAPPLGEIAVTPRHLADYRNMFLLTDEELRSGPILDCPAGASPFGAQVRARGGTVVSVDPAYGADREELIARIRHDLRRITAWQEAHPENFDWSYLGSPGAMSRAWEVAVDLFAADYAPDGDRYVAAALPELPFPDDTFGLTLSSHYLFVYPQHLSYEGHIAGLMELLRVTSGEVRVYPLVDSASVPYPQLDELRADLASLQVHTEVRQANCAFNPGGDRMLVCRRYPVR